MSETTLLELRFLMTQGDGLQSGISGDSRRPGQVAPGSEHQPAGTYFTTHPNAVPPWRHDRP